MGKKKQPDLNLVILCRKRGKTFIYSIGPSAATSRKGEKGTLRKETEPWLRRK